MEATTEVVTAAPAPVLAAFIDRYVGYRMTGFEPGLHRGLPSRHMTFIVAVGPTIDVVEQTDPRQAPGSYRCVLSGLQAAPAMIAHTGFQEGVAIELTPLGSRVLFGMPASEMWDVTIECSQAQRNLGDQLADAVHAQPDWPNRFAACDRALTAAARTESVLGPELTWAWRTLVHTGGTAPISPLAARIGWSRQHLTRKFTAEFGASPKLAARIIRFERARRMLTSTPSYVSIAQIAATCGYYDQAHLNRDFAELAGVAPTAWLAEEIPSVQDPEAAEARG
ncbi:AraC family transcriptional regulator [Nocardia caishijiensis]|uniref:AraC family transcriptional regulator n=1 Tax=Nocardia caishijiensis TaxID=184756 RepID=A0ABQ6YJX7_9NOCA|nr:helix-turn-helix domain-containing protein [Nocardia caishijiensis]KAF0846105.1 AraC family transcriptional regulator [Nocardia caishijiensis]